MLHLHITTRWHVPMTRVLHGPSLDRRVTALLPGELAINHPAPFNPTTIFKAYFTQNAALSYDLIYHDKTLQNNGVSSHVTNDHVPDCIASDGKNPASSKVARSPISTYKITMHTIRLAYCQRECLARGHVLVSSHLRDSSPI